MKLSERLAQLAGDQEYDKRVVPATPAPRQKDKGVPPASAAGNEERADAEVPAPGHARGADRGAAREEGRAPTAGSRRLTIDHHGEALENLKVQVRGAVVKELGPRLASGAIGESDLRLRLEYHLTEAMRSSSVSVSPRERADFYNTMLADMLGWGPLEDLMADGDITEIMCNAHDEIWIERAGKLRPSNAKFASVGAYRQVIDRMLAVAGRRVDEAAPMADGRLLDGSRINAIIPPLVVGEPVLTIRRFPEVPFTVTDLIRLESLSKDAAVFLEAAVRGKLNVLVSGGTGTGKTSLLNVLSNFIPVDERVITIEDAAELKLGQPHVVRLEARPSNIEGVGQVTIRDLVRNALRMRPDRIVVGEVRGPEAVDMLQAMNTGHEGSLTTVHANTARDALSRLETMVLFAGLDLPLKAVREQIASGLDVVIQLARRPDGRRVVDRIAEVQGREGDTITMQDVFTREGDAPLKATGLRPKCTETMKERGVTVPPAIFRDGAAAAGGR